MRGQHGQKRKRNRDPVRELGRNLLLGTLLGTLLIVIAAQRGAIERTLDQAGDPGVHVALHWDSETGRLAHEPAAAVESRLGVAVDLPPLRPAVRVALPDFDAERQRLFLLRIAGLRALPAIDAPSRPLAIPLPTTVPPVAYAATAAGEG